MRLDLPLAGRQPFTPRIKPYWRARGLVMVFAGHRLLWSLHKGKIPLAPTGGPKLQPSKFGLVSGFGSTHGSGTTDRLDGGVLPRPSSGWRSIVSHYYANGPGGGGFGRIFTENLSTPTEMVYVNSSRMSYYVYASASVGQWDAPVSSLATGRWQSFGVTHDQRTMGNVPTEYLDGTSVSVVVQSNSSGVYNSAAFSPVFGNRPSDSARCWDGLIGPVLFFDGPLTAAEHLILSKNPWSILEIDPMLLVFGSAAGASQNINPGSGHLTAIGKQPTVSQSDHHTITPALAHLTAIGKQPTVSQSDHHTITPALAHLTAIGKQPTVSQSDHHTITPALAHLTAIGKQPTVTQSAGTTVQPGIGHLVASGKQPTVTRTDHQTVSPGAGHLALSGKQPTVTQSGPIIVSPSTWHLICTGHQPTVSQIFGGDIPNTPEDTWDRALSDVFDPFYGVFGEDAVVAGTPVVGLFSARSQDSFGLVQATGATLRMSAKHAAAVGDVVTVGSRTYQIAGIHDLDGSGTEKTLDLK